VTIVLDHTLSAYTRRHPDEAPLRPATGVPVRCAAIVQDDLGRVLQRKDPSARMWLFPTTEVAPTDESLGSVAVRALVLQMGMVGEAGPEPVDISIGADGLVVSYLVSVADVTAVDPDVARSARWAPWDTILDERLGRKLA
jgi:hypothetical protein